MGQLVVIIPLHAYAKQLLFLTQSLETVSVHLVFCMMLPSVPVRIVLKTRSNQNILRLNIARLAQMLETLGRPVKPQGKQVQKVVFARKITSGLRTTALLVRV
jgi:hypothetical protein